MFHLAADALSSFLRTELKASPQDLDISFDAPDREWSAKLNRPTVNCYLWDLGPNLKEAVSGMERIEENGKQYRRPFLPRFDLRYLVTAWSKESRDEQQLLGGVVRAFAARSQLSEDLLAEPLASLRPLPTIHLQPRQADERPDFWQALGGRYRAGVDIMLTVTLDPLIRFEVPAAPTEVEQRLEDTTEPARRDRRFWRRREPAGV